MLISDWSSDVCSSDLQRGRLRQPARPTPGGPLRPTGRWPSPAAARRRVPAHGRGRSGDLPKGRTDRRAARPPGAWGTTGPGMNDAFRGDPVRDLRVAVIGAGMAAIASVI